MIKDREAGRNKRAFKVLPRVYIGYLVGYISSNIYRIWVPLFRKVIISRNIIFDENIFFDLIKYKKRVGQLFSEVKRVIEAIEENEI